MLPLTRIGAAVKALGVDPFNLLRMVIMEYYPAHMDAQRLALWTVIEEACGRLVSQNEYEIVKAIRAEAGNTDPKMKKVISERALVAFAKTLT